MTPILTEPDVAGIPPIPDSPIPDERPPPDIEAVPPDMGDRRNEGRDGSNSDRAKGRNDRLADPPIRDRMKPPNDPL